MLRVKDFRVAGAADCRVRRLPPSQAGDKPPRYIFLSAKRGWAQMLSTRIDSPIPECDSGRAFIAIARAGIGRHAKV